MDRDGALVDVMLSDHRDLAAAKVFFRSAKTVSGATPDRVTTDGHDAYPRAIRTECGKLVRHRTAITFSSRPAWTSDRAGTKKASTPPATAIASL